ESECLPARLTVAAAACTQNRRTGTADMSLKIDEVLQRARPVMPVLVIEDLGLAVDLAHALHAGGIEVLEVTLRTSAALDAVAAIRKALPNLLVGTGTVSHAEQF